MRIDELTLGSRLLTSFSVKHLFVLSCIACLTAACAPTGTSQPTPTSLAAMAMEMTANVPTPTAPSRLTPPPMTSTSAARGMTLTPSPASPRPAATATPADGQMEITIGDYYFYPQVVTVTVGTTVTWMPVGVLFHTIVSKDSPPVFEGATGGVGTRVFRFTFRKPGVYAYHCDYHPGAMDAWVVVIEGS